MELRRTAPEEALAFAESALNTPENEKWVKAGVLKFLEEKLKDFEILGCYENDELEAVAAYESGNYRIVLLLSREKRKGYGSFLLDALKEKAEAEHAARLTVNAVGEAIPFYEKHGFERSGELQDHGGLSSAAMEYLLGRKYLGAVVDVTVDHPYGSMHPHIADQQYPLNTGYVYMEGEIIDAYVYGPEEPLETFTGVVLGIIYRRQSDHIRLIVGRIEETFRPEDVLQKIGFEEQYYETRILWR